jgi:VWFA-related protein
MFRKWEGIGWLLVLLLCLVAAGVMAQQADTKSAQNIPDAPSATRPPQQFPPPTAKPLPEPPGEPGPPEEPVPGGTAQKPANPPDSKAAPQQPEAAQTNSRNELFTISRPVNFVVVPVTVKDRDTGRMVDGLLPDDFSVFEDGVKQKLSFFTSDPFPLSAAVIIDQGMPDVALQKVNQTFSALMGAFSQFDEVSLYTYSMAVTRLTDFRAADQKLTAMLNQMKIEHGRNNGVPVVSGPLASGPMINGMPVQTGVATVSTPPKESHVLNDAILRAAVDLAKQERTRRKIIFIISEGREQGSTASYADTLKVLLTNQISVYAVSTGSSSLPVYDQVSRLHLPRQGYNNLLPKYAAATGGEIFSEFSQQAMERAYTGATGIARNQYTLGYQAKASASGGYREIEVRVKRPNLDVRAKRGYYPLPPGR